MTKRRWLKSAIEEAKKPQAALPWGRRAARVDYAAVGAKSPAVERSAKF